MAILQGRELGDDEMLRQGLDGDQPDTPGDTAIFIAEIIGQFDHARFDRYGLCNHASPACRQFIAIGMSGSFTIKRIGALALGLYASRDFLARHPADKLAVPIDGRDVIAWSDPLSFTAVPKARRSWADESDAALTVDSMAANLLAVKSGRGFGVLPCIMGDADYDIERVRPDLFHREEDIWLVVHEDIRHTRRVREVCGFLETIIRDMDTALRGMPDLATAQARLRAAP